MSAPEDTGPEVTRDDPMIAAEWALGLLEGEELLAARGKAATDPHFAWRKAWWDNWFAPWTDEMAGGAEPGDHVWEGIAARVAPQPGASSASATAAAIDEIPATHCQRRTRASSATTLTAGTSGDAAATSAVACCAAMRAAIPFHT
jgi:anti-sigma-K factor RskA